MLYVFRQTLEVETGAKHIYIGANLKEEHIEAFKQNKPISPSNEGPAVNMVMTPDPTHSGQGTDIAMFGQIKMANGSEDIVISEGTTDYYLSGNLERLTAKVLLTCDEGEPGLVRTGGLGWVETSKIRYTLNVTNKHTYINKHWDTQYSVNMDPNWSLTSWVIAGASGYEAKDDHAEQFEAWDHDMLMQRLFDDRYSAVPLRYDESKVGAGNSDKHYVEGLYCLENTAYNDMELSGDALDNAARVATTHVVMAVRFLPRRFYGGAGTLIEAESLDKVLTYYLVNGAGSGPYVNGTYFTRVVNGTLTYYAYTGMQKTIQDSGGTLSEADFTRYEGGYSYYTTFIDGNADNLKLTYNGCDSWGVQRDHYYILTVDKITRPGTPIPWDDYIRVNSQTVNWNHRGSQDVIIRPTGD